MKANLQSEKSSYDIPESHKELVRKRIKETKQEDFIAWNVAIKKLIENKFNKKNIS